MTEQEQRIAIAEACPKLFEISNGAVFYRGSWEGVDSYVNPLADLNAMHEVEKSLCSTGDSFPETARYGQILCEVLDVYLEDQPDGWDAFALLQATAAQRAEAFLRVKGLWKEEA